MDIFQLCIRIIIGLAVIPSLGIYCAVKIAWNIFQIIECKKSPYITIQKKEKEIALYKSNIRKYIITFLLVLFVIVFPIAKLIF